MLDRQKPKFITMKKLFKIVGVLAIGMIVHACGNPNTNNDNMDNDMDNMNDMEMDTTTIDTTDSVAIQPESF